MIPWSHSPWLANAKVVCSCYYKIHSFITSSTDFYRTTFLLNNHMGSPNLQDRGNLCSYLRMDEIAQSIQHELWKQKDLSLTQVEMCTLVIPALRSQKLKDSLRLTSQPVQPIGKLWNSISKRKVNIDPKNNTGTRPLASRHMCKHMHTYKIFKKALCCYF